MNTNDSSHPATGERSATRRKFLADAGRLAAGTALAGVAIPHVHAAGGDDTIQLALIGSGSRGSGAVANAMESTGGPVRLVAMADLFKDRLVKAHKVLQSNFSYRVEVPEDRQFVGFDAFKRAIDCLRPGRDIAMLTGYAGFRPAQLEYAVSKGANVFMEKSFATDPPGVRRIIKAGEDAEKKGVRIAAGLMCRHSRNRQALIQRIRDGELGEILSVRATRMEASGPLKPRPAETKEIEWQLRNFTKFLWVSGGLFAEMDIHQIDEICWIKDGTPIAAHGVGGRVAGSADCSQNLDSFAAEWTFPDGTHACDVVRYIPGCYNEFSTYVHGTKRAAQFSGNGHAGTVRIFKDQRIGREHVDWEAAKEEVNPWQAQWNDFLGAIRNNRPFNQARSAALSNLTDIMGRAAIHMGRIITWDEAFASNFQFAPSIDELSFDGPAPLTADAAGRYPVPVPGAWVEI